MNYNLLLCLAITVTTVACNDSKTTSEKATTMDSAKTTMSIREDSVTYTDGSTSLKGYISYDDNKKGKRPAVLIVPEWWGLGNYTRGRAKQLAELGYIAMALDMYGNGKTAADPKEAQALATPAYKDPTITLTRLNAAMTKLKEYAQVDTSNMAAIGYCYGGYVVLNAAKQGADLKGVVSFHGNLGGVPVDKQKLKAKILVCHGAADQFVKAEEVAAFKHSMDSAGVDYTFKAYPNATHAFTNPEATANGKKFSIPIEYNAAADSASWNDMKEFFGKIFH